jgi:tetraacyldisaccharide 4'-kinase
MSAWKTRRHPLVWLLLPLATLYAIWANWKKGRSRAHLRQLKLPSKPQIWVVGNLWVGGAGKTPLVCEIAQRAVSNGMQVALISKGYGTQQQESRLVHPSDTPESVGDEPLWLARTTGLPVVVGPNRAVSIDLLMSTNPDLDLIICDDGLLNAQLVRHREIVVLDERGLGNRWCIPAGPLRMPFDRHPFMPGALRTWVMSTSSQSQHQASPRDELQLPWCEVHRELADHLYSLEHPEQTVRVTELSSSSVAAFAGIAKPEIFFDMLVAAGLHLKLRICYPDHRCPDGDTPHPWGDANIWICTAKDAVKLHDLPQAVRNKIWVASLKLHVSDSLWKNLNLN